MMFEHKFFDLPEITDSKTDGKRYYKTPEGNSYPSVTTILSSVESPVGLQKWRARVGAETADRITAVAATRGTNIHTLCEKYVRNDPNYLKEMGPDICAIFGGMRASINKIGPIYAIEAGLYSDKYKFAGRTDVIGDFMAIPAIIDFKGTSSAVTPTSDKVFKYGHQLGAYSIAWEERTGMRIDQGILIFGSIDHGPKTFRIKLDEHKKIFLGILEKYHAVQKTI